MASVFQISLVTLSILSGVLSLQTVDGFQLENITTNYCQAVNYNGFGTFNATGFVKQSEFLSKEGSSPKEWTWHTGLAAPASNMTTVSQLFWVDTGMDSVNLNAPDIQFRTCSRLYTRLADSVYNRTISDNGNCEDVIGKSCLDALRSKVSQRNSDEISCWDLFNFRMPEECQVLVQEHTAVNWEFTNPPNATSSTNSTNSCGSTLDNPDGRKSAFLSVDLTNTETKDFELYDTVAKRVYFMIAVPSQNDNGQNKTETRFTCLRNTDFAQGSRNPLPTQQPSGTPSQPQPQPTNKTGAPGSSASINGVGMTSSLVAAVMVLMVVFG